MLQKIKLSSLILTSIIFLSIVGNAASQEASVEEKIAEVENEIKVIQGAELPWIKDKEPRKSKNNIERIKFTRPSEDIEPEKVKKIITSLDKLLDENGDLQLKISANSYDEKDKEKARNKGLLMISQLEKALMQEKYKLNYDNISYFVHPKTADKAKVSYIDIDKF